MQHVDDFIRAAVVPRDRSHSEGGLDEANDLLAINPDLSRASIHAAAVLGDVAFMKGVLRQDPAAAVRKGGPYDWDPLTHLCFSRYLRLDTNRSPDFLDCSRMLLAGGASAITGFYEPGDDTDTFECVLYGASGVAHHAELARVLIEHGADPNDDEVAYHTPETYDNRAMHVLVETGRMTAENMSMMLIRKLDWHDHDGALWLLENGADPRALPEFRWSPLHHAIARGNALETILLLLDHGADPATEFDGGTGFVAAARAGRGDLLDALRDRGIPVELRGVDRLIGACATGNFDEAQLIASADPALLTRLIAQDGEHIGRFALSGNAEGVSCLLDLGVPVDARFRGDAYRGLPAFSTALHAASWLARHDIVRLLIERGADVNARDSHDRTPLMYAVRACVDSYWMSRRSPESVAALLRAGASRDGIPNVVGYDDVDRRLHEFA